MLYFISKYQNDYIISKTVKINWNYVEHQLKLNQKLVF